jgi:hypothetical protein
MSMPNTPIRLDSSELYSPKVEAYLEEQAVLRRAVPEEDRRPLLIRILYANYFYLSLAGMAGALAAWAMLEPFFGEEEAAHKRVGLVGFLLFPTVAGMIGLFLGSVEGLICRNPLRALICAVVGLGVGFGGGLLALIPAGLIFAIMVQITVHFWKNPQPNQMPTGLPLLILIMGRAAAWAVAAIPAGLGQGIALRERKVLLNGLLGSALGGLVGGLLFDPIALVLQSHETAAVSRAVGFAVIGIMVGLFVGLVEQWTKTAWLLMKTGPLAGKQFILHRTPSVLGSSPKADVYLFKDAAIEPRHALIHNRGGRFEIEDCETADGTYVNGIPVQRRVLQTGDQIVLGKTLLEFVLREQ